MTRDQVFIALSLLCAVLLVVAAWVATTVVAPCREAAEKLRTCNCSDFCARPYYYQGVQVPAPRDPED